jgi:hypothetical protein
MLGRASARVDENSRKRMRVARTVRTLRSPLKGKERVRAAVGTRSLDELHDHTNLLNASNEHHASASGAHYSSLPIMPPKTAPSQAVCDSALTDTDTDDVPIMNLDGAVDGTSCSSTRERSLTRHAPPRALTTEDPQGHVTPSSPTSVRLVPTTVRPPVQPALQPKPVAEVAKSAKPTTLAPPPLAPLASACPQADTPTPTRPPATDAVAGAARRKGAGGSAALMTPESLPRRGTSVSSTTNISTTTASQSLLSSSQAHRRALGMTRTASASSSSVRHSSAVKRPFRPPRVQSPTKSQSQQQWQQKDAKSPGGSDPDSSFDLAFDFDPEALEAAMRRYD